jgi:hypothetical protein
LPERRGKFPALGGIQRCLVAMVGKDALSGINEQLSGI